MSHATTPEARQKGQGQVPMHRDAAPGIELSGILALKGR